MVGVRYSVTFSIFSHEIRLCSKLYFMGVVSLIVAAVSELEANERGSSLIGRRSYIVQNARNCVSGKIKGTMNCGYARMEKLTCVVFHMFSRVKECLEVGFSQLC